MSHQITILLISSLFVLIIGACELLLLRFLNRTWWRNKIIRRAAYTLPLFGLLMVAIWGAAEYHAINWIKFPSAILAILAVILELALMISLPVSGIIHFISFLIDKIAHKNSVPDPENALTSRRFFLKSAAAALPVISMTSGLAGITGALGETRIFKKVMYFPNLPADIEGFRILHLSDIHLRQYITLDDLALVLDEARQYEPNLVLVTGDIADDLTLLPEALSMFDQTNTSHGAYASLGNHEYFRGVAQVKNIFNRSPIPLFVNQGVTVKVGNSSLFIGGLDDPVRMGAKDNAFFQNALAKTIPVNNGDDFKIIMSHRPDALDAAAEIGVDLVLAGHTHGGQIGFSGRSAFESVWPDRYLWGEYHRGNSQLYTTSGVGHWFPFRLNCAAEAPVIVLKRA